MDLAALIEQAAREHRQDINDEATKNPGQPIQVVFDWHPQTGNLDAAVRPSRRLRTIRAPRPGPHT